VYVRVRVYVCNVQTRSRTALQNGIVINDTVVTAFVVCVWFVPSLRLVVCVCVCVYV